MAVKASKAKQERFLEDMMRCRGIEFARLGMMVEVNGEMGTIEGVNVRANLDIRYANQLKHGAELHNCHPEWKVKYFDEAGTVIAHFDENNCLFRPDRAGA